MRYLVLFFSSILLFTACEKVENPTTREDELRNGKWAVSNVTIKYDPYVGTDTLYQVYQDQYQDCHKDNYLVFLPNYQGTQSNPTKCNSAEPSETSFQWKLEDNGNQIDFWAAEGTLFNRPDVSAPFVSYTDNSFAIRFVELVTLPNTHQDTFTYTYTFRKF